MSALKKWRVKNKLTQTEAANVLRISVSSICQIEQGNRRPGLAMCKRIEAATNGALTRKKLRPDWAKK